MLMKTLLIKFWNSVLCALRLPWVLARMLPLCNHKTWVYLVLWFRGNWVEYFTTGGYIVSSAAAVCCREVSQYKVSPTKKFLPRCIWMAFWHEQSDTSFWYYSIEKAIQEQFFLNDKLHVVCVLSSWSDEFSAILQDVFDWSLLILTKLRHNFGKLDGWLVVLPVCWAFANWEGNAKTKSSYELHVVCVPSLWTDEFNLLWKDLLQLLPSWSSSEFGSEFHSALIGTSGGEVKDFNCNHISTSTFVPWECRVHMSVG